MTALHITHQRLYNQFIAASTLNSPVDVVRRLGAVQAQDYPAAKWAVGLRTQTPADTAVERAYTDGHILRTHVLRPTWQFIVPADIRWMLSLTSSRIKAATASYYRKLELDPSILSIGNSIIEKALQGGNQMTRPELKALFEQAGVISATDGPSRSIYIIVNAEIDGIVCSGAIRGRQHTVALLEERVPNTRVLSRDEALAELASRYFTSRGPATLKDYIWWSGLSVIDAKAGLEMIKPNLTEEVIDGQSYWMAAMAAMDPPLPSVSSSGSPSVYLLPNYDEYIVSYTDRRAMADPDRIQKVDARNNFLFNHTIVIDGQIAGTWKRTFKKDGVEITPNLFVPISDPASQALAAEISRYRQFLGMRAFEVDGDDL